MPEAVPMKGPVAIEELPWKEWSAVWPSWRR